MYKINLTQNTNLLPLQYITIQGGVHMYSKFSIPIKVLQNISGVCSYLSLEITLPNFSIGILVPPLLLSEEMYQQTKNTYKFVILGPDFRITYPTLHFKGEIELHGVISPVQGEINLQTKTGFISRA